MGSSVSAARRLDRMPLGRIFNLGFEEKIVATTGKKVAFITGANKGMGLETARGLGELGIAVVLASRDEAKGRAAAEKLKSEGIARVEPVRFDVTGPEDHRAIARFLEDRYG